MITKKSSATIDSGSQKSRAWTQLAQVGAGDHPRRATACFGVRLTVDGSLVLPADREVQLFEARGLRLDAA